MKKGYIVTWFNCGRNYGQTLQAYALQKKLRQMNFDAVILNYGAGFYSRSRILHYLKRRCAITGERWQIQKKFDAFVKKEMEISKPLHSYQDVQCFLKKEKPDFLVCGSDQIWNPYSADPVFFLHGLGTEETRKIAYAVSICDKVRADKFDEHPEVNQWLQGIKEIYVRENTGAEILRERFGKESTVVLDPTLLFSGEEWVQMLGLRRSGSESYILCYAFNLTESQNRFLRARAAKNNAKVVYGNILMDGKEHSKDTQWSPVDFLNAIYNAEEIVTDSFHGMVFSILFHKEFWVFDNGQDADSDPYYNIDRMNTLLAKIGLRDRLCGEEPTGASSVIDYVRVDSALKKAREDCIRLLCSNLD